MRELRLIVAVALLVAGIVWIFQGAGLLKGSFMTGEARWLWIGVACALAGAALLVVTLRTSRR